MEMYMEELIKNLRTNKDKYFCQWTELFLYIHYDDYDLKTINISNKSKYWENLSKYFNERDNSYITPKEHLIELFELNGKKSEKKDEKEQDNLFTVEEISTLLFDNNLISGQFYKKKFTGDNYFSIQSKKESHKQWDFHVSSETFGDNSYIFISFNNRFRREELIEKFNELNIQFNKDYFQGKEGDLFQIPVKYFKGWHWDE